MTHPLLPISVLPWIAVAACAQRPDAPLPDAHEHRVVVEPMSYGQVWWQIRARSREELEAAFARLVALPDAALPTFVEVRLSPAAAEEIGESGLNTTFPRANGLHARGYLGHFYEDPRWGTSIDGRARVGDFYLEAEDLYRGSESAVGWGAWVLWNAGIPAVETVHMYLFLDVPRRLREQARDVLVSDPEWPRYADQIWFVRG